MSNELSRRLSIVLPHLYPNLVNDPVNGDYYLENMSDGKGTQLVWLTSKVTKPTDTELANAKEAAVDADWWRLLRKKRDEKLALEHADVKAVANSGIWTQAIKDDYAALLASREE